MFICQMFPKNAEIIVSFLKSDLETILWFSTFVEFDQGFGSGSGFAFYILPNKCCRALNTCHVNFSLPFLYELWCDIVMMIYVEQIANLAMQFEFGSK